MITKVKKPTGRPREWKLGKVIEPPFKQSHPEQMVHFMEQGLFDYEIMAEFKICKDTYWRWIRENVDFKQAHEIGKPLRFRWWLTEGKKRFADSSDKGYKFWVTIMNNMFADMGWISEYGKANTQININNMQVVQKTETELLESIKTNFNRLQPSTQFTLLDAVPEIKTLTND